MDLDKIKKVIDLINENDLSEFSYEEHNKYKICLKKGGDMPAMIAAPAVGAAPAAPSAGAAPVAASSGEVVESPLVGTFYAKPSPEAPDFVSVGDEVNEDTVICIVEAMKVMNEITAGLNGTITEILVKDAEPVEYGQPLFKIKVK
ncbi:MAG: acetyl-CoA carboxylase biotin carboxyl carrier protein [Lentisphaeraceae bacterium]|nr:acetyl-CoA carboxylase biotin carboxyl carrier protein [Lentisphaeraceae bacterium]